MPSASAALACVAVGAAALWYISPQRVVPLETSPPRDSLSPAVQAAKEDLADITPATLRQTLRWPTTTSGTNGSWRCPKRFCRLKIVSGALYRGGRCDMRRPTWRMLVAMTMSAMHATDTRLPDAELCLHESSRSLSHATKGKYSTHGAPVSQWCAVEGGW